MTQCLEDARTAGQSKGLKLFLMVMCIMALRESKGKTMTTTLRFEARIIFEFDDPSRVAGWKAEFEQALSRTLPAAALPEELALSVMDPMSRREFGDFPVYCRVDQETAPEQYCAELLPYIKRSFDDQLAKIKAKC